MTWRKTIYDNLTNCAALCDEFATECSRSADIDNWYRSIFLNLDCADLCRQLAMLYARGSENTRLLAKACIEVCEKCAYEVKQIDTQRGRQVYSMCQQTIKSCVGILAMQHQSDVESGNLTTTTASLVYGIDLRETLRN